MALRCAHPLDDDDDDVTDATTTSLAFRPPLGVRLTTPERTVASATPKVCSADDSRQLPHQDIFLTSNMSDYNSQYDPHIPRMAEALEGLGKDTGYPRSNRPNNRYLAGQHQ